MFLDNKISQAFVIYKPCALRTSLQEFKCGQGGNAQPLLQRELAYLYRSQFSLTPFSETGVNYTLVDLEGAWVL